MKYPTSLSVLQLLSPLVFGLLQAAILLLRYEANWLEVGLLVLGTAIGVAILFADRLYLHQYYAEAGDQAADTAHVPGLVTRSLVFMMTLIPLGLFIISSTGSRLGVGVLLGFIGGLTLELWWFREQVELFHQLYLFQLRRRMSAEEVSRMVLIAAAVLCAATLLLFR